MSEKVDTSPAAIERLANTMREDHLHFHHPSDNHLDCPELLTANALEALTAERDDFQRKYHEAMDILSVWNKIDLATAVGQLQEERAKNSRDADTIEQLRKAIRTALDSPCMMGAADIEVLAGVLDATPPSRNEMLEKRIAELELYLRGIGYHAKGECHHGLTHWVGDHCAYDCTVLAAVKEEG